MERLREAEDAGAARRAALEEAAAAAARPVPSASTGRYSLVPSKLAEAGVSASAHG